MDVSFFREVWKARRCSATASKTPCHCLLNSNTRHCPISAERIAMTFQLRGCYQQCSFTRWLLRKAFVISRRYIFMCSCMYMLYITKPEQATRLKKEFGCLDSMAMRADARPSLVLQEKQRARFQVQEPSSQFPVIRKSDHQICPAAW